MQHSLPLLMEIIDVFNAGGTQHSKDVTKFSLLLGKALEFDELSLSILEFSATVHDIGKIAIPHSILTKPARFTKEEYRAVQRHTIKGGEILSKVYDDYPDSIREFKTRTIFIVETHHENEDGSGYPYKLAHEAIPKEAKVIRLADSFVAMLTTDRPWRAPHSWDSALLDMENHVKWYDIDFLTVFESLIEKENSQ